MTTPKQKSQKQIMDPEAAGKVVSTVDGAEEVLPKLRGGYGIKRSVRRKTRKIAWMVRRVMGR
jgi:hypothetical protein